ncbi:nucleolar protein 14 [Engystomops pustulosus]|uniref:nucleolar protein 14 n=1 Tax=Engystomops pustulosus TaxID=76066 RepID=UPI003AFA86AE
MGKNNNNNKKKKGKKPLAAAPGKVAKARSEVRNNPFEVKINKQKFTVLGRKTKHDVGLPGVSKSKALRKRKETLLKEYQKRGKSNVFVDKRFGEYDSKLTSEEKMMKRFALERQKHVDKKSLYNLNEEEELTHYGQSLASLEKMNDPVDSDSDTDERGALSAELTAAHFGGGGLLRKKAASEQTEEEPEKAKSRKELIEELIAKSKLEKRERQNQKEKTHELTEKLDNDWKAIQGLLSHKVPKSERKAEPEKPKPDDYDMTVRQLVFDMKAKPSDKMKSEEEIAKEEQEKLQKLEAERLRRMRGYTEKKEKKPKHISADDLMDGFILEKDDRVMLSYKDGKMNLPEPEDNNLKTGGGDNDGVDDDDDKDINDGNDAGDDDDGEADEDAEGSDEEEEGSDDEDNHSDLDSNEESEEEDDEVRVKMAKKDKKVKEKVAEEASAQLPFTFDVPESYEDFQSLLCDKPADQQLIVLERIQKCNHPSLADGNKAKLEKLFGFLLDYITDLSEQETPDLQTVDKMIVPLYNLCQMFPEAAADCVRNVLQDIARAVNEEIESKDRASYPALHVLLYFKITGILFPTSDYWHPVVTPAFIVMSQLLSKCPVNSLEDAAAGLFVSSMVLEYVSLSKRFVPEMINFLLGILHLATPRKADVDYVVVPPFKLHGKSVELLLVDCTTDSASWVKSNLPLTSINGLDTEDGTEINHFKLTCIAVCLDLVRRCVDNYGTSPAFKEIFSPIEKVIREYLPRNTYPETIQDLCKNILEDIERCSKKPYSPLVFEKQLPVPVKMYTPRVTPVLDFGKKRAANKEDRERKRLVNKHKREYKSAIREIRRDNEFLAREKLAETMQKDAERKRKLKAIFHDLSTQEGEWKALKRLKMKRK